MLFFKKPVRPRRAPAAVKTRLRVEQLETRLTPTVFMESPPTTVASAVGSTPSTALGAPAVATDADGDYVVTWASNGTDGSGWGIYAQRYSSTGTAKGATTRVNTTTSGDQQDPSVSMDSVGDYVVTWSSYGQDGSGWGVYAQRYNACGVAQGGEIRVNWTTAGDQMHARVAMDSTGNFTVVWQSYGQDGSGWGVFGRRYSCLGVPLSCEFQINNTSAGDQAYPAIAMNGLGAFVVTWSSYGQDGSGWGVYARRYTAAGTAQGSEFLVNTTTAGDQMYSAVGIDGAGDYMISWSSNGQDGSGWGVYARRYNCSGVAQGGEFLVNTTTAGDQTNSAVAMDGSGNFIITWSSNQGGSWSNYGQQFSACGAAQGSQFQIGSTTASYQTYSGVAMTATGSFILVCNGTDSNGNNGIFSQLGQLC
jgi:hypothetical protein